jgi:hypothetical protein
VARHLSEKNIRDICSMLDGWKGPLTWNALLAGVKGLTGQMYSRQALDSHDEIKTAYAVRKGILQNVKDAEAVAGGPAASGRPTEERMARLVAENARLRAENDRLLGMFAVWAYNAALHGLNKERLNQPMPSTDRGRTNVAGLGFAKKADQAE